MGGRNGDYHGKTRVLIGGMEKIIYEETVNGVKIVRIRWKKKKTKEKIK